MSERPAQGSAMVVAGLLVIGGVLATLIGSQLPWADVEVDGSSFPLTFFLDMGSIGTILSVIGTILSVIGGALGVLGLTGSASRRAVGAMTIVLGVVVAAGSVFLVMQINEENLTVDEAFQGAYENADVTIGGVALALGGALFASIRSDDRPPVPVGGGTGLTPPGWYESGPGSVRYWTGSRWTHTRRYQARAAAAETDQAQSGPGTGSY